MCIFCRSGIPVHIEPYKRLVMPDPPAGMAYGIDTDYWRPVRGGSNLEVPKFPQNASAAQIAPVTEKSKLRRDRAFAKAFLRARTLGLWERAGNGGVAIAAFWRLRRRAA